MWPLPEVPADYWSNTSLWWQAPIGAQNRSGHGLFDALTPPVAAKLLSANASSALCPALTELLRAASTGDFGSVCASSGVCADRLAGLTPLFSTVGDSVNANLEPCALCDNLQGGPQEAAQEEGRGRGGRGRRAGAARSLA